MHFASSLSELRRIASVGRRSQALKRGKMLRRNSAVTKSDEEYR